MCILNHFWRMLDRALGKVHQTDKGFEFESIVLSRPFFCQIANLSQYLPHDTIKFVFDEIFRPKSNEYDTNGSFTWLFETIWCHNTNKAGKELENKKVPTPMPLSYDPLVRDSSYIVRDIACHFFKYEEIAF